MARGSVRSFVFTIDFRVPEPDRSWPVVEAHRQTFADLVAAAGCGRSSVCPKHKPPMQAEVAGRV